MRSADPASSSGQLSNPLLSACDAFRHPLMLITRSLTNAQPSAQIIQETQAGSENDHGIFIY